MRPLGCVAHPFQVCREKRWSKSQAAVLSLLTLLQPSLLLIDYGHFQVSCSSTLT